MFYKIYADFSQKPIVIVKKAKRVLSVLLLNISRSRSILLMNPSLAPQLYEPLWHTWIPYTATPYLLFFHWSGRGGLHGSNFPARPGISWRKRLSLFHINDVSEVHGLWSTWSYFWLISKPEKWEIVGWYGFSNRKGNVPLLESLLFVPVMFSSFPRFYALRYDIAIPAFAFVIWYICFSSCSHFHVF